MRGRKIYLNTTCWPFPSLTWQCSPSPPPSPHWWWYSSQCNFGKMRSIRCAVVHCWLWLLHHHRIAYMYWHSLEIAPLARGINVCAATLAYIYICKYSVVVNANCSASDVVHDERAPKKCTNNTSGTMHWRACAVPKTNCYNMHVNVHMALLPLLPLSTTCTMKWLQLSLRKSHNVFRRLFWLVLATLAATNWKYLNRDCLFKQHRSTAVAQKRRATHGHTTHTHTHA